eukprot:1805385-Rhodomonas_salina.1
MEDDEATESDGELESSTDTDGQAELPLTLELQEQVSGFVAKEKAIAGKKKCRVWTDSERLMVLDRLYTACTGCMLRLLGAVGWKLVRPRGGVIKEEPIQPQGPKLGGGTFRPTAFGPFPSKRTPGANRGNHGTLRAQICSSKLNFRVVPSSTANGFRKGTRVHR